MRQHSKQFSHELEFFRYDPYLQRCKLTNDEETIRDNLVPPRSTSKLQLLGAKLRMWASGGEPRGEYKALRDRAANAEKNLDNLAFLATSRMSGRTVTARQATLHFLPEGAGVQISQPDGPNYELRRERLLEPVFSTRVELDVPLPGDQKITAIARLDVLPPSQAAEHCEQINGLLESVLSGVKDD